MRNNIKQMKTAEEFQSGHTKFTNATVHGPSPTHYVSQVMWTFYVNIFIIHTSEDLPTLKVCRTIKEKRRNLPHSCHCSIEYCFAEITWFLCKTLVGLCNAMDTSNKRSHADTKSHLYYLNHTF